MNQLLIQSLKVPTTIGVFDWEQKIQQTLLIDLDLTLQNITEEDTLDATIDYDALSQYITHLLQSRTFQLIETVAITLAEALKRRDARITGVTVTVSKPFALRNAQNVAVRIRR